MSQDQTTVAAKTPAAETTLRLIPAGEQFSSVTEYLGNGKVNAVFAIRRHENGPRYAKKCLFDFSRVTEEQLHLLAMYGAKVRVQALLRGISEAEMLNPSTYATVDVSSMPKAPRDSEAAAFSSLLKKGYTVETIAEALAQYAAKK
jgi:hypothetical protein